jgi:DNA-binding transcriptional LysR family regulator
MLANSVMVVNFKIPIDSFRFLMTSSRRKGPHANRIDRLRVRHLRLLELIGNTGSLTAAAAALHIGQPTASKLLQDLEEAFGHVLVDRNTRGGALSVAGERALERLKIATGALDAIGEAMTADAAAPLVRIGMLPFAGVTLIPRLVARLAARDALPRMHLREGPVSVVLALLREGQIDCVIGRISPDIGERDDNAYDILPLNDEHFEIACRPDHLLARRRKLDLHQLGDQSWILPPRDTYTREVFDAAFVSNGVKPPAARIESRSFHVSLATVAETSLLTIAPRSAVDFYASLGRVRKLRLAKPFQTDCAVFVTLKTSVSLPSVELIKWELQKLAG